MDPNIGKRRGKCLVMSVAEIVILSKQVIICYTKI